MAKPGFSRFPKAFDLVDHTILIRLLHDNFEIDPLLVNIVISFLSDRSQVVKYKNTFSNPLPRYCGIPQGTLLGPLLFLVMINEIGKEFPQRWKYVDDLSILEVCHRNIKSDPVEILTQCSDESKNLNMTVNPTKSQIMTINFLKSTPAFCDPIPSEMLVKHVKLLGVTISNDLKWDTHVSNIVKQANVSLSIFKLLNKFNCPKIHSLRVYLSFIRPLLEYACPVWHSQLSNELSDKIESVQKRSLRIIYKEGKIPYSFLLKAARITTLKERREKICLLFAKSVISNPRTEDLLPDFHNPIRLRLPRSASLAIPTYSPIHAVTERFRKSFIPFILEHLNNNS